MAVINPTQVLINGTITGGTIDGTTIGGTTPAAGTFTTLTASTSLTTPTVQATNSAGLSLKNSVGTTQISMGAGGGDNLSINVSTNLNGTNAQIDISPTGTGHVHIKPTGVNSVEIAPTSVGEIDNMTIGAATPAAGTFTTLIGGGGSANYGQLTGGATTNPVEIKSLGTDTNIDLTLTPKGTGTVKTSGTGLQLTGSTSGYVGLKGAAAAGSTTYTLPAADGTNGQVLSTNGSATLSWAAASGGGALAKQTNVFTSGTAATYTAPANTQWVKITVVGGGAIGGATTGGRAQGGSAGGVAIKWLAMTAGQTLIYTVGTASLASTVSSGTLTISTITANGGTNGGTSSYAQSSTATVAGGTATGGDINITGGEGGRAYGTSTAITTQVCGKGGDCPGFGTGGIGAAITAGAGGNAQGFGAGGGGGLNSFSFGSAGAGVVIFEAY